ncbi:DNA-binding transcriptional response regulator, NtrC family, contains REC, AAA-type ATPase, and a Fis-type DNA-binding domains [Faunimonas pinastri]|uniref:DNA-binding transcriptional regulator NtrC n=1 Tax=Faunimonas pinastri TaxID=1855383 RepID=A0A1H8Z2V2_9HYPH|nr:sigma-54 dependent transcriptional regulator [Faunimonas pinastri]SEP58683.1 DNA-binding transcriptional response regulator, NtrC family, contains REC, AAA-type ATPase, and a Fis-type DNA-binding domains [Faunimonas pinastri]
MASHVLIVDDDPALCGQIEGIVQTSGYRCETAASGEAALNRLSRADAPEIRVMILDLDMPGLDGMAVLERLKAVAPALPVIVQVEAGRMEDARAAMRSGAFDFMVKPADPERVQVSLGNALRHGALAREITRITRQGTDQLTFDDIVMRSPSMHRIVDLGLRAARSNIPVLLEGERGVGKEMVARAIHGGSTRRSKPFVVVRCGSFSPSEIDAVLFGSDRPGQSRTGKPESGRVQESHCGTLFLDDIGELPLDVQAKLLRVLQTGEVVSAEGRRSAKVDVRLIAATKRRLVDLVSAGHIREDLFYKINVFPIWVPPLKDRRDDVPDLAARFLAHFAAEEGKPALKIVSRAASELLMSYDWPGNVRQLQSAVFQAVALCDGPTLLPSHFPHVYAALDPSAIKAKSAGQPPVDLAALFQTGTVTPARQFDGEMAPALSEVEERTPSPRYGMAKLLDEQGEVRPFGTLEEEVIRFAVDHYRGRMSEVARRLGIGRSTLYRKMKDFGIDAVHVAAE